MTLVAVLFFTVALSAENFGTTGTNVISKENSEISTNIVTGGCLVRVDCDGDGIWDYSSTVGCEYSGALAQQYLDFCP